MGGLIRDVRCAEGLGQFRLGVSLNSLACLGGMRNLLCLRLGKKGNIVRVD